MKNNALKIVIVFQSCVLLSEQQTDHQEKTTVFLVAEVNCCRVLIYIKNMNKMRTLLSYFGPNSEFAHTKLYKVHHLTSTQSSPITDLLNDQLLKFVCKF